MFKYDYNTEEPPEVHPSIVALQKHEEKGAKREEKYGLNTA